MENSVNAHPSIARVKSRRAKSRSRVLRTTLGRIAECFFRSRLQRIDGLTPHLQYDIGLTDIRPSRSGARSSTREDFFPHF
jgi:hypothetical protein